MKNTSDKLCCFAETKNGSLLLATDRGTIGIIDVSKSLTIWISIMKPYYDQNSPLNPHDNLYEDGTKTLIDVIFIYFIYKLIKISVFFFKSICVFFSYVLTTKIIK
jgi:hypothetical protein